MADRERSPLWQAETRRRLPAHLVDGLFQRQDFLLPDIVAEDAGEGSVEARVRLTGQMQPVAADHLPRPLHDGADVLLMRPVMHVAGPQFVLFQQAADPRS